MRNPAGQSAIPVSYTHLDVYKRQELHEKIRVYAQQAAKDVKEEGGKNDLIERICADPSFGLDYEEIEAILKPEDFTGRSAAQVEGSAQMRSMRDVYKRQP